MVMEDSKEVSRNVEELFTRDSCNAKLIAHRHSHQSHACGEPCSRCECSSKHDNESTETRRRKKKSKLDRRHCHDDIRNSSSMKTRSVPKLHRNNGHSHGYSHGNCHRQQQVQQHRGNEDEDVSTILNDIVNKGLANEQSEYLNFAQSRTSTKKDFYWNCDQLSQEIQDISDENECCIEKCYEDHRRSNKCKASKEGVDAISKRRETDWPQGEDDERLKRECERAKSRYALRESKKSKNVEHQRCKEENLSSVVDLPERRKESVNEEIKAKKKEHHFTSKLPVLSTGSRSPSRQRIPPKTSNRNIERQDQRNRNIQWIEASTSYHRVDGDTDFEFSREEELCKELESIPYSKPFHRPRIGRNVELAKLFETTRQKEEHEKHGNSVPLLKAGQPNNDDLDLHASKSHILNLIDRALSKEFGSLEEKKSNETREEITQQELRLERSRAHQGDCCHNTLSTGQTLLNYRGILDYESHLRNLRWEYLDHIRDKFRKLYDLEKILDDCSSLRISSTDHPLRYYCLRARPSSPQQEQKESTS